MNTERAYIKSFDDLFHSIQECKLAKTCPGRDVRQFYYENDDTACNNPVIFVCESPSTRGGYGDGSTKEQCWVITNEDRHFRSMLKSIGLEDAYITNFVKCGTKARCKPTDSNLYNCLPFLLAEIKLIRPKLIVCVGKKLLSFANRHLRSEAKIMHVNHYSWRRRPNYNQKKEKDLSLEIKKCLNFV